MARSPAGRWGRELAVAGLDSAVGLLALWTLARSFIRPPLPPLWIEVAFIDAAVADLALALFSLGVLAFVVLPDALREVVRWAAGAAALVCAVDAVRVMALSSERLHEAAPWSLSVFTAGVLLLWSAWAAAPRRRPQRRQILRRVALVTALAPVALAASVYTFGRSDYRRPADAVVVFGAAVYQDGSASLSLSDRTRTACRLVLDGLADTLVVSGGHGEGMRYSEPEVMARIAREMGVPEEAIVLDVQGVNTRATVCNAARAAQERGWDSVLMVSHDYHLARIKMFCRQLDLEAYTVPAEESRALAEWRYFFLRELAAIGWYATRPPPAAVADEAPEVRA